MPLHFFFFLAANSINYLVVAMLSVSLGWHIYQATANPLHLALIGLMQILPVFLFFLQQVGSSTASHGKKYWRLVQFSTHLFWLVYLL